MGSWEGVWQQLGHLSRPGWVVTEGGERSSVASTGNIRQAAGQGPGPGDLIISTGPHRGSLTGRDDKCLKLQI